MALIFNVPTPTETRVLIVNRGRAGIGITEVVDNEDGTVSFTFSDGSLSEPISLLANAVLEAIDPANPPSDFQPNRYYRESGTPFVIRRTTAGQWKRVNETDFTPAGAPVAPVISTFTIAPNPPNIGQSATVEVRTTGGLPDAVTITAGGVSLSVSYPDGTTDRAVATFTPSVGGDVTIATTATNTAGSDSDSMLITVPAAPGGDPLRYFGTSATDLLAQIALGDASGAALAIQGMQSVQDANVAFSSLTLDHGATLPATFAYFAFDASLAGADAMEFSINGGVFWNDAYPSATIPIGGVDHVVYRSPNALLSDVTYEAR